jgi:DNA polymerase elongation subunit (family B)
MSLKTQFFNFMPFHWTYEDEKDDDGTYQTVIRAYGWNENNESVYCFIPDFDIPVWLELPDNIEWTESQINKLNIALKNMYYPKGNNPTTIKNVYKEKLYYANLEKNKEGKYVNKKYSFIELSFRSSKAISSFVYSLKRKPLNVVGIGEVKLKVHTAENSVTPVLKLLAIADLPSSSWIKCKGILIPEKDKTSTKKYEYRVSCRDLKKIDEEQAMQMPIVYPKIMSYDIEVYSSIKGKMPNPNNPNDKVFMIGVTMLTQKGKDKEYKKYMLSLSNPNDVEDVETIRYKTEGDMYIGFSRLMRELDPDVIIGYNIFGFDIPYMHARCETLRVKTEFENMSSIKGKPAILKEINWESSAYGKQELKYVDVEGRLFIDLLPYIKRNYKWSNYRLETACEEILKDSNKDPLKAKDLFRIWERKKPDELSLVSKYCAQDTWVTLKIFEKALIWFDLVESASINGVPMFYLYTKGQQIKMYSQVLKYCYHHGIIVQSNAYEVKEDETYSGAYVRDPIPGIYEKILPFDFASLYPSIMQSYNLDFTKLVNDNTTEGKRIPDEMCHVFDWIEHKGCAHDPDVIASNQRKKEREEKSIKKLVKEGMTEEEAIKFLKDKNAEKPPPKEKHIVCGHFKYRFLKSEITGDGVVPTLLTFLLKARKDVRKIIAQNKEKIKQLKKEGKNDEADNLADINIVLDKRQNAYKVSANSMYGATGSKFGLAILPVAMVTTYVGRVSIKKAAKYLEDEYNAKIYYGDTDSVYLSFPAVENMSSEETWKYCEDVVEDIYGKGLFPSKMRLEFEDKICVKYLILTKKRYCAYMMNREGIISDKMFVRGIALTRRDNCKFLRNVYESSIRYILDNSAQLTSLNEEMTRTEILKNEAVNGLLNLINDNINSLFQRTYGYKDFVITQGLTKLEYKNKSPPAHFAVAQKMMNRGIAVPVGIRIEYVVTDLMNGYNKNVKKFEKTEDMSYFNEHKEVLRIDYLHYLESQGVVPLDELIRVCCKLEGEMDRIFSYRLNHNKMVYSLKKLFSPKINWVE